MTVHDVRQCSVAGTLLAGGICSHTLSDETFDISYSEILDLLYSQPERSCVPVPGLPVCKDDQSQGEIVKLPARGASLILSPNDYNEIKTSLEVACRMLKKRCSYDIQKTISSMQKVISGNVAHTIPQP